MTELTLQIDFMLMLAWFILILGIMLVKDVIFLSIVTSFYLTLSLYMVNDGYFMVYGSFFFFMSCIITLYAVKRIIEDVTRQRKQKKIMNSRGMRRG